MAKKAAVLVEPLIKTVIEDPNRFVSQVQGIPSFSFDWGYPKERNGKKLSPKLRGKRRLIGHPNKAMRELHSLFGRYLREKLIAMGEDGRYLYRPLSATGCVTGSNPTLNAEQHSKGKFYFVTDFAHAYPSVDLERLSLLLVFVLRYDYYRVDYSVATFARNELAHFAIRCDPLYLQVLSFVQFAFGGLYGRGLAVGGPLSPLLLNLYCEVYLDSRLRLYFLTQLDKRSPERTVTYTRYVDDLVFSRGIAIPSEVRATVRRFVEEAGFDINHRKSRVLSQAMGTTFITQVGMRLPAASHATSLNVLVFPQRKRRKLHGIIRSYLATPMQNDAPEVVRGFVAEFLYYYKRVVNPTMTDAKTFALCQEFQKVSGPYRKRYKERTAVHR